MADNVMQGQKNELPVKFGMFIAPLEELLESKTTPTVQQCRLAIQKFEER